MPSPEPFSDFHLPRLEELGPRCASRESAAVGITVNRGSPTTSIPWCSRTRRCQSEHARHSPLPSSTVPPRGERTELARGRRRFNPVHHSDRST